MNNGIKNKEGGFIELIVVIIVVLLVMSYFHISISGIFNWFAALFNSVR